MSRTLTTILIFCAMLGGTPLVFSQRLDEKRKPHDQSLIWQKIMPKLTEMMEGPGQCPDDAKGIRIVQTADVTGDGVPEALIEYCHMGAYTSDLALMQIEDGKVVEARFRDQKGKNSSVGFLQGASVRNGEDTKLLPEKHAVYAIHWHTDDSGALASCTVDAYAWSAKSHTFNVNLRLGKLIAQLECVKLQRQLDCVAGACPN